MKLRNLRQLALLAAALGLLTLPACKITDVKTTYGPTKPMAGANFSEKTPGTTPESAPSAPQYAAAPPVEMAPPQTEEPYPVQLTSGEQPIDQPAADMPVGMPAPETYYQANAPMAQPAMMGMGMPCPPGPYGPGCGPGGYGGNCYSGNCGPGVGGCLPDGAGMPGCRNEDEWVCDGGDRFQHTVIGQDFSIRGLDIEDTVAHYDTLDGCRKVTPSNQVCVYAPRFAAVRKIYGLNAELKNERLLANRADLELLGQANNGIPTNVNQPLQPVGNLAAKMPSIFRERTLGVELENRQVLHEFIKDFQAFEDFNIMKVGIFDATQKARLATSIQNAIAWTENQAVQVMIEGQKAHEGTYEQAAQEALMFDLHGKPCLRIVKLASVDNAQPGDIVEFTLRFDNLGDQRVGNVTIIDNLSPRLEFVEGSAQCSIDSDFLTQPNEKESLILRWEIKEPLEVGEGGVCRFKCRVR
ncbi:DUF11 domain-containing protein [Blastopirellula marina]|uniref:DUF11 domain-containing protein n=1 Tax=Blastopirellula marina TaxID=124 RepID=A0A2S8FD40_9BACT|nr:DUF11 domain-containing protein [Blastopirellula marina]PQO30069.1 hypothetical protein C5Y98_21160 [Blastopirellula marina]PQO43128.1 hypothetical protein C5Y93_25810 [Blastopirellula marina]PTL42507.1 hypothetical protein C5Y97_21170 [Blastopirellula marina]